MSPDPEAATGCTWDPRSDEVLDDQIAAYDEMRSRCPVAHSDYLGWSLFRHADVLRAVADHETFSSAVSTHVAVPNGMDPPEHTVYRAIVDRYFTPELAARFEPLCRRIADALVGPLLFQGRIDVVADLAEPYASGVQSAYLGWPERLRKPLSEWNLANRHATLARDRAALDALAEQFDDHITGLLDERRALGAAAPDDLTTLLLTETVDGRPLTDAELVSMLRNWTVGELGTIVAAVGIVVHYLAERPDVQTTLRRYPELVGEAVDEILRIHPPLIANRRVVARPTTVAGVPLEPGEPVTLLWASANRDERVFGDPDTFELGRPPHDNLLYGAGVHACPGAPLARVELRVLTQTLLAATTQIASDPDATPVRAAYPAGGFAALTARLR